ncbi:hypothetical protein EB796_002891 [Bugula neritina]|uniref:Uncharacterized protein n=1 Tax=Bugula neritina TaxID=10212 RepID=A0A7J7KJB6_BUGNE|nr:hypothetical protein EB796_002891 [Bugula neritina]
MHVLSSARICHLSKENKIYYLLARLKITLFRYLLPVSNYQLIKGSYEKTTTTTTTLEGGKRYFGGAAAYLTPSFVKIVIYEIQVV